MYYCAKSRQKSSNQFGLYIYRKQYGRFYFRSICNYNVRLIKNGTRNFLRKLVDLVL